MARKASGSRKDPPSQKKPTKRKAETSLSATEEVLSVTSSPSQQSNTKQEQIDLSQPSAVQGTQWEDLPFQLQLWLYENPKEEPFNTLEKWYPNGQ